MMLDKVVAYKYPITIVFFVVWMIFFDTNSVVFMYKQYNELKELKKQEQFLEADINEMSQLRDELLSDDKNLERFARENFYFKKDNEDVFVIEKKD